MKRVNWSQWFRIIPPDRQFGPAHHVDAQIRAWERGMRWYRVALDGPLKSQYARRKP